MSSEPCKRRSRRHQRKYKRTIPTKHCLSTSTKTHFHIIVQFSKLYISTFMFSSECKIEFPNRMCLTNIATFFKTLNTRITIANACQCAKNGKPIK